MFSQTRILAAFLLLALPLTAAFSASTPLSIKAIGSSKLGILPINGSARADYLVTNTSPQTLTFNLEKISGIKTLPIDSKSCAATQTLSSGAS